MTEQARELLVGALTQSWVRYEILKLRCSKKTRRSAIHDFRTEIRRMIAILDLIRVIAPEAPALAELRRSVNRELHRVRELRDIQVQERRTADDSDLRALSRRLKARERKIKKRIRDSLRSNRKNLVRFAKVRRSVEKIEDPSAKTKLDRAITETYRELARCSNRVDPRDLESIHRLRIRFRKYRYACDAIPGLCLLERGGRFRADRFQKLLGELQDTVVLMGMLRRKERAYLPRLEVETNDQVSRILKERGAAIGSLRPRRVRR
jgi:CHAD domain-containing protein